MGNRDDGFFVKADDERKTKMPSSYRNRRKAFE